MATHTVHPQSPQPAANSLPADPLSVRPDSFAPGNALGLPEKRPAPSHASHFRRLLQSIPTILVFAALVGLGTFGHYHGWKIPKFSELTGQIAAPAVKWCDDHGVPAGICVACNADLMPKGTLFGWCREHGVAECLLEHPELAQVTSPVAVSPEDAGRSSRALAIRDRPKNEPSCKLHLRRIQFASAMAADKAGIDIGLVDRGEVVETLSASGEIRYDPTLVTRLSSRASGTMWRVERNVGDSVRKGDLVALMDAAQVGQVKAELLEAAAQFNLHDQAVVRLAELDDIVAGRRLQEAVASRDESEASLRKAVQILANLGLPITLDEVRGKSATEISDHLHFLGLPPEQVNELDLRRTTDNLIPIFSPRDGVIVERDVVEGEVIDTTRTLFTIVDNRRMWLLLDVPLEEARYVQVGQPIICRPDGGTSEHSGPITWISPHVDPETRTVKVRAELANDQGDLRDESFGTGRIVLRKESGAIVVPSEAIHWEGCCWVAFVRDKNYLAEGSYKVFHTRMVRPGVANGDKTEVIAGLLPGEVVVTDGSGVLRAELLKGNLGAG